MKQLQNLLTAPNPDLVRRISGLGANELTRCYQCGTCSVVCPVTPYESAFPRQQMVWAQWGLQDKLLQDADVWLCHQCNECSTYCPRDARPGDLMAAVRAYQIEHYAAPRFLVKATSSLRYLPLAFIPPVLLTFFLVFFAVIIPEGGLVYPAGEIHFRDFISPTYIDIFSAIAVGFAATVSWIGARRFWKAVHRSRADAPRVQKGFIISLLLTLVDVATHSYFRMCKVNKPRGRAHLAIFYGFLFLFAATTGSFIYLLLGKDLSLPISDPVKIIGNVGGIALFLGLTWISWRRLTRRDEAGRGRYFDWYFVGVLYVLTITGFVVEAARYADLRDWAYPLYAFHLVFYFMLFTYLPFTKFAHVIYRTLALTYARQTDRRPGTHQPVVEAA